MVTAPESAKDVNVTSFNNTHVALTYDKTRKEWVGEIEVPADAKEGQYPMDVSVASGTSSPAAGHVDRRPEDAAGHPNKPLRSAWPRAIQPM